MTDDQWKRLEPLARAESAARLHYENLVYLRSLPQHMRVPELAQAIGRAETEAVSAKAALESATAELARSRTLLLGELD